MRHTHRSRIASSAIITMTLLGWTAASYPANDQLSLEIPATNFKVTDVTDTGIKTRPATKSTASNWAGISCYYLWSCNASIRTEALNAVRAAGLKVLRVFLLSTEGEGAIPACSGTPTPDVEPRTVGVWDDTILERLDDLMAEAAARQIKLTVALHDRWSLGCWRSDAYQAKYNITKTNCKRSPGMNNPTRFYSEGRADFVQRIKHILSYTSRHTGKPLGQWSDALFSVEAENEAFGDADITPNNTDWLCSMSAIIRAHLHPAILVTSGGGGIGKAVGEAALVRARALAACSAIDVIALHSYSKPETIDEELTNYRNAIGTRRLILQEWGTTGSNSTAQATAFTAIAAIAAKHGVPQMYWGLQPSHLPLPSTSLLISPPGPAPSPGPQRTRGIDGRWINQCSNTSCPTEVWVTALYPAAQSSALQSITEEWPEIWGCDSDSDCQYNGQCIAGICVCNPGWRGPTCAALRLGLAPRKNGLKQADGTSTWGGSITKDEKGGWHMFASQITGRCGLDFWSTNSEIVRATASSPLGPFTVQEVVAPRFAHEPNVVFGTGMNSTVLLATSYPDPPLHFPNCSGDFGSEILSEVATDPPHRNTYVWSARSPEEISAATRQLAIPAAKWNTDVDHRGAICDTNAAAAVGPTGGLVGLWRHCEGADLHTVPHSFTAANGSNGSSYQPNISVNVPFMSHAGAEDPMVWSSPAPGDNANIIFHAILHDEQISRCADGPVGCWPGGRHAFSVDGGVTWNYSAFDAYNGTVAYTDGSIEQFYLRARPHMVIDEGGTPIALSNGVRPLKASQYVYTLVQPIDTS